MIGNRHQRRVAAKEWQAVSGKALVCALAGRACRVHNAPGEEGYAVLSFTAVSGKHPFSVVISAGDAAELVTTLIKAGSSKILDPADLRLVV